MKWRTDKPTADVIVVYLKDSCYPQVLVYDKDKQSYYEEHGALVNMQDIVKWTPFLEEDETVTDCNELEEEINQWLEHGKITDTRYDDYDDGDIKATARHFAEWGAEHRDRFLNWIRDLIKKGIEKPEEALNILKRIDALINDDSLWGEHLKK